MSVESAFSGEHLLQIICKLAHCCMNYSQKGAVFYETPCMSDILPLRWVMLNNASEYWTNIYYENRTQGTLKTINRKSTTG